MPPGIAEIVLGLSQALLGVEGLGPGEPGAARAIKLYPLVHDIAVEVATRPDLVVQLRKVVHQERERRVESVRLGSLRARLDLVRGRSNGMLDVRCLFLADPRGFCRLLSDSVGFWSLIFSDQRASAGSPERTAPSGVGLDIFRVVENPPYALGGASTRAQYMASRRVVPMAEIARNPWWRTRRSAVPSFVTAIAALAAAGCGSEDEAVPVASVVSALSVCDEIVPSEHFVDGIPAYDQCAESMNSAIYSSNGIDTNTTGGDGWVRTQWSGGYQCTELANRYLFFAWGIAWTPNGDAGTWCDSTPPSDSGLELTAAPVHGDLIVFSPGVCGADSTYGHVAVVDVVDSRAARVTIVEQNAAGRRTSDVSCAACFVHVTENGGNQGTGGSAGASAGGSAGSGADPSTGGTAATGGVTLTGGAETSGGATGIVAPSGGTTQTGGASATGGATSETGGAPATGGAPVTGGTTSLVAATGGDSALTASGGLSGAGGASPVPTGGAPSTESGGTPPVMGGSPPVMGGSPPATGGIGTPVSEPSSPATQDDSGCGCRVPAKRRPGSPAPIALLGVVLAIAARRRGRPRSRPSSPRE